MLDQIVIANTRGAGRFDEFAHRTKLVVSREDHRLLLDLAPLIVPFFVDLQVDEAGPEVKKAVSLENFFP
jgi:hypothetical protein